MYYYIVFEHMEPELTEFDVGYSIKARNVQDAAAQIVKDMDLDVKYVTITNEDYYILAKVEFRV